MKTKIIRKATHSMSDNLLACLITYVKFNLDLSVFVCGQIVTDGNGTAEIGTSNSLKSIDTGRSIHSTTTFLTITLHTNTETPMAINQKHLKSNVI